MEVLNNQFDVIVVGAGIMGSCTAYEVAKRGLRPLLLEQFDFLHHLGSSHGESRTIRCAYPRHHYIPMVLDSFRLWEEAEAEIGYRVLTKTQHLNMGPTGDEKLQSIADSVLETQTLNPAQVSDKFSGAFRLPEDWIGLVTERSGVLKPSKAVAMFQSLAIRRGAVLKDRMEVVEIKKHGHPDGISVTTAGGNTFWGKKCVVTAGAWTQKLVKTVRGIDLPIRPLHTVVCYWKIKQGFDEALTPEVGFPTFSSYGSIFGTPSMEFPGLVKILMDAGRPCDPDRRDWGSEEGLVEPVRRWIEKVMPDRVETDGGPVMTQGCMYSMTPDEDFVIDFLGGELGRDVAVAGGFSGHGFKMGPVIGRILAQMAVDGEAAGVDMEWFRLGRFEDINPAGNVKGFVDH